MGKEKAHKQHFGDRWGKEWSQNNHKWKMQKKNTELNSPLFEDASSLHVGNINTTDNIIPQITYIPQPHTWHG